MHDDVIKWKHFPRHRPFVRRIHRSPVNSPHKGQWRRALMFSLICARINGWVNNREASNLIHHRVHYDVIVMEWLYPSFVRDFVTHPRHEYNVVSAVPLLRLGHRLVTSNSPMRMVLPIHILTHWGRDKVDAIFQTTLSNAYSWMKIFGFR